VYLNQIEDSKRLLNLVKYRTKSPNCQEKIWRAYCGEQIYRSVLIFHGGKPRNRDGLVLKKHKVFEGDAGFVINPPQSDQSTNREPRRTPSDRKEF